MFIQKGVLLFAKIAYCRLEDFSAAMQVHVHYRNRNVSACKLQLLTIVRLYIVLIELLVEKLFIMRSGINCMSVNLVLI